ncbi:PKS-NRPS hybrid synthetase [Fusarium oxysporum f. sp. cubense]|uniref:PKS-NRPS hybrid synthetase n=1 Tax=Fusarium oxysporum f. sp. cubense TaxID=61366 RepID=A0A559LJJ3_FUSOC|nr:PKS-NRPS hybrid synthetase [Fusarium oxysporum f. sp. cubense]
MCDRRRNHPIVSRERQRKTTTRTTGCEFSVLAKENKDRSTWTLRHRSESRFSLHNHEPSQDTTAHPVLRTMSKEHLSQLTGLANAGIAPKEIRTFMRQNTDTIATQQDIYNRIADARREVCQGQSSINALADQLFREGFWSQFQTGPDGRVKAVLFAHPESVAYLQAYPDVLILDCTYKTNKYGMPLLDLIGVDSCQRSFCVAFAFLSGECEEDYFWALDRFRSLCENHRIRHPSVILTDRCLACMNAVDTCFPSSRPLLCLWHVNKAVLHYCQPGFTRQTQGDNPGIEAWDEFYGHWHSIIKSPNEQTFHERVSEFEKKYLPDYIEEVRYIKTNWLDQYKEKLVKAWVNQHPHFDNVVTSRVEGIHWLLKSHLKVATLDLFEAWQSIKHALLNQLAELKSNQAKQKIRTPIELSSTLYGA